MSDIAPVKSQIQNEEATYPAAASSSFATRVGSSINFINLYQHIERQWVLNGKYGASTGSQINVDGVIPILFNMTIVGFCMFNAVAGASGTTEIDIQRRINSGASSSSIFSVTPKITSAAGNGAYMIKQYGPDLVLDNPAGTTLPTFSVLDLNAGDVLHLNFVTRQSGAESLTISLFMKPR